MGNKELIVKKLHQLIDKCIGGPRGDPTRDTLIPASIAVEILDLMGESDSVDQDAIDCLSGDNVEKHNYLGD